MYAHIELDGAPVTALPYQPVSGFLHTIASLVTSTERKPYGGDRTEYEEAKRTIDYNLAETMWNAVRDYTLGHPSWAELEVNLQGTPRPLLSHRGPREGETYAGAGGSGCTPNRLKARMP